MITLNTNQLNTIEELCNDKFILMVLTNLRQKQPEKVVEYSNDKLKELIKFIIKWAINYDLVIENDLEYLINIFFYYKLSNEKIKSPEVIEIFGYPNRKGEDKIITFHYLLENQNI